MAIAGLFLVVLVLAFVVLGKGDSTVNTQSQVSSANSSQTATDLKIPAFFYTDYCPHCAKMKPIVRELQEEGYQIEWVNVEENDRLAEKYQIIGVPTFIRPDGERLIGEQSKEELRRFLRGYKK